ncbi:MAG: lactonase family protein [Opitutaceae bacterium]
MRAFVILSFMSLATMLHAKTLVYFGGYARGPEAGIHVSTFDVETGALGAPQDAANMSQAGFLAIHPDGRHLYAVGERERGVVRAFEIDRSSGKLETLNDRSSGGPGPCHVSLDRDGRHVFSANYTGASVSAIRIREDGALGAQTARMTYEGSSVHPTRQTKSFAHSANLDPSGRFLIVADLGSDRILVHRFDAETGALEPNDPAFAAVAPGSGPRHFAFHPGGAHGYVVNELSNTVTVFDWDAAAGVLAEKQTLSTLPAGFEEQTTSAEIVVHPNGRFLYTSNRGHDSIAIFSIDAATGKLTAIGHEPSGGDTPRNFALAPGGRWMLVANQASDSIIVFAVDGEQGALRRHGPSIPVPNPTCVRFLTIEASSP